MLALQRAPAARVAVRARTADGRFEGAELRRPFKSEMRSKGDAASGACLPALQRAPAARGAVRLADGKLAIRAGWACKPSPSNPTSQGAQAPCSLR